MATRMQQRRGTAAQWTSADPILAAGEIGFETDTGKFKIGDGTSVWSSLSYFTDSQDFDTTNFVLLNSNGVIPIDLIPQGVALDTELTNIIDEHNNTLLNVHGIENTADLATQGYADSAATSAVDTHNSTTLNVHGIENTAGLATQSYADSAATSAVDTHNGTTLNVHGIANTADLATETYASTYADGAVSTHDTTTLDVHGIANTADLATNSSVSDDIATHNLVTTNVHGIVDTSDLLVTSDLTAHSGDTTNVHGIADTSAIVLTDDARLSDERTPLDASVTDAKIDGTLSQSSITNLTTDLAAKAPLESPALTGTPTAPTATAGDNSTQVATTAYVETAVSNLVASAPGTLDTLNELAAALGDDANFSTTVTNSLALKLEQSNLDNATYYAFNAQTASYTLALSDSTNMVTINSGSGTTVTVPSNSSVAFPVGTYIDIFQLGAGQVTVAEGSGVTIYATPGKKLRTQYSGASLVKRDTDTWYLTGDIVA